MGLSYTDYHILFCGNYKQSQKNKVPQLENMNDKEGKVLTERDDVLNRLKQYFDELTKEN